MMAATTSFATDDLIKMVMEHNSCTYEEAVKFLIDFTKQQN